MENSKFRKGALFHVFSNSPDKRNKMVKTREDETVEDYRQKTNELVKFRPKEVSLFTEHRSDQSQFFSNLSKFRMFYTYVENNDNNK